MKITLNHGLIDWENDFRPVVTIRPLVRLAMGVARRHRLLVADPSELTCTPIVHTLAMRYEWDKTKQATNLRKHGIEFADAVGVFDDPRALTMEDRDQDEQRFVTCALDGLGRALVVVYAYPEPDVIRLISAQKAEPYERRNYEE
ncbi:MAG: BrnT family toxin [Acidiferrobacter sp.]